MNSTPEKLIGLAAVCVVVALCAVAGLDTASAAADSQGLPYGVQVFHDDERGVTCWVYRELQAGGLSCIPDHMLQAGPTGPYRVEF